MKRFYFWEGIIVAALGALVGSFSAIATTDWSAVLIGFLAMVAGAIMLYNSLEE